MSIKVMSWVWETRLAGVQKLMLLAIADHANDRGENAFPGMDRLAFKCSVSNRTAQRTIDNLEAARMIHINIHGGIQTKHGQWTNRYTVIGYKAEVLGEDISEYKARPRPDKNVTPSENEDPTKTSSLDPTNLSPLDGQDPTKTSPKPSEKNQPSGINHQNQSSEDDDDDDKTFSIQVEILDVFDKTTAFDLIEKYDCDRVLHACRFVLENAEIRFKTKYAKAMIESTEPLAALAKKYYDVPESDWPPDLVGEVALKLLGPELPPVDTRETAWWEVAKSQLGATESESLAWHVLRDAKLCQITHDGVFVIKMRNQALLERVEAGQFPDSIEMILSQVRGQETRVRFV